MENINNVEHFYIITIALSALIIILLSVAGFLLKQWARRVNEEIEEVKKEVSLLKMQYSDMKTNYLDRFKLANEHVTNEVKTIREDIFNVKTELIERFYELKPIRKKR